VALRHASLLESVNPKSSSLGGVESAGLPRTKGRSTERFFHIRAFFISKMSSCIGFSRCAVVGGAACVPETKAIREINLQKLSEKPDNLQAGPNEI
jgi:hypothetical protein